MQVVEIPLPATVGKDYLRFNIDEKGIALASREITDRLGSNITDIERMNGKYRVIKSIYVRTGALQKLMDDEEYIIAPHELLSHLSLK